MDRDALLKQVTVLGFMVTDLHLFLNTHPDDKEALKMYNDVLEKERKARMAYENECGPLGYGTVSETEWLWSKCPWPWQESFNYKNNPSVAMDWKKPYGEELL